MNRLRKSCEMKNGLRKHVIALNEKIKKWQISKNCGILKAKSNGTADGSMLSVHRSIER